MKNISHANLDHLRLVAWEITRSCNLNCIHCRAAAEKGPYPGELSTSRCMEILEEINQVGNPIVILTGGEPLLREDVFEISTRGTELGLKMVLATNGTLVTPSAAERMRQSGIGRVSVSLDGPRSEEHDGFRKVPGAFDAAIAGIQLLKEHGIEFQINTTITRHNAHLVEEILELAVDLGAIAHHIFLLVPTGRAREMVDQEIEAREYEELLHWFYRARDKAKIHLKATCAPHYHRVLRQEAHIRGEQVNLNTHGLDAVTRGCLGGTGFCFISHDGVVQPCGYLEVDCGNIKDSNFRNVWKNSPVFRKLRDLSKYKGKCGRCEYIRVCGGCRARAYEATGDFLEAEPLCSYEPARGESYGQVG